MSPNKQKILELERMGKYVFHGSAKGDIEVLEPRQSTHIKNIDDPEDKGSPDGEPAVAATPYAEIAIFRAIVNGNNIKSNHTSGFGFKQDEPNKMYFNLSPKSALVEAQDNKIGFVYVFNKSDFSPYLRDGIADEGSMEWRCYKPIKPLEVIPISSNDLTLEIN